MNRTRNFVIPNYRIFAPNFFNFKIILVLSISKEFVASKVSLTRFSAPCHDAPLPENFDVLLEKRLNLPMLLGGVLSNSAIPLNSSTTLHTGNLWRYAPDGSRWVQKNCVIRVPPKIYTHFIIIFPTPEEGVPITMSPSINGIAFLFSIHNELVSQPRTNYCNLFQPYNYFLQ